MTPPMKHSGWSRNKTSSKEFSPSLGSIDSEVPVSPTNGTTWDTETDHILSFFLGGDAPTGRSLPDFASSGSANHAHHPGAGVAVGPTTTTRDDEKNNNEKHNPAEETNNHEQPAADDDMEEDVDDDDEAQPPPTPAVHFYAPTASSSSSLSTIAASLVTGGPLVYQQMQQQQQQQQQLLQQQQQQLLQQQHVRPAPGTNSPMDNPSPISPAALIGSGQENLMLPGASGPTTIRPPPPSSASLLGGDSSKQAPPAAAMSERERHLAWLRDLNAMAKVASGGSSAGATTAQPMHIGGGVTAATTTMNRSGAPLLIPPSACAAAGATAAYHHGAAASPLAAPNHHHPMLYAQAAAAVMMPPHHHHHRHHQPKPQVESAEKRAKRLERNRESAKRSRRKKKERLSTLEAQVNKLHREIEAERRKQLNEMVPSLRKCRETALSDSQSEQTTQDDDESVSNVIHSTGSNSKLAWAMLDFQHNSLKQLVLPRYHKILLWFALRKDSFFFAGKEEYASRQDATSLSSSRSSAAKISSKQIGDEMTNGVKGEKGDSSKRVTFKDTKDNTSSGGEKPNQTAHANDAARMWPLFCYELTFSVDQEDKFVATHKRMQEKDGLAGSHYSQAIAAVRTADSLREAVESLSRVVSQREERTLLGILSPTQVSAYHRWLALNRMRSRDILERRGTPAESSSFPTESSLHDICKKLNEVLQISKTDK